MVLIMIYTMLSCITFIRLCCYCINDMLWFFVDLILYSIAFVSCCIMLHHTMPYHIISYHVTSGFTTYIMLYHIISYGVYINIYIYLCMSVLYVSNSRCHACEGCLQE